MGKFYFLSFLTVFFVIVWAFSYSPYNPINGALLAAAMSGIFAGKELLK